MSSQSSRRHRSDTVDTAGTLTSVEKARLLEEMPSYHDDEDDDDDAHCADGEEASGAVRKKPSGHDSSEHEKDDDNKHDDDDDDGSDDDSLWGDPTQDDLELYGGTRSELASRPTHRQFLKERGWKSAKQIRKQQKREKEAKAGQQKTGGRGGGGGNERSNGSKKREDTANGNGGEWQPAKKRRKTGRDSLDGTTLVVSTTNDNGTHGDDSKPSAADSKSAVTAADDNANASGSTQPADPATVAAAKSRLSKWAQRLFDPDRPRGVIETPEIIPLNDEFLTAFGKREREMDEAKNNAANGGEGGAKEKKLDAEPDAEDDEDDADSMQPATKASKRNCKIKITNLAYTTTSRTIISTFANFGDVVAVHLVPDPNNPYQSLGRGYVTFNEADEAQKAVEEMDGKRLDGRLLRIGIAADRPGGGTKKRRRSMDDNGGADGGGGADLLAGDAGARGGGGGGGPGGGGPKPSDRYWDKDISTKCFNCGEVGHRSDSCPNPTKVPPCNLCGNVTVADGTAQGPHDSWSCPFKAICFNCGVPGHVARDCPENRGGRGRGAPPPRRVVCGRCYRSGHHRWQCRENVQRVSQHEAQCQIPSCGRRGHFACRKMGWFFGLRGTYCFNCGRKGHHGMSCDRPKLDDCARNPELAEDEIDEAGLESLHKEMEERREGGRDRSRDRSRDRGRDRSRDRSRSTERRGGGGGGRSRAKSQPPPREAGRYKEGRRRSSGGGGGGGGGGGRNQQRGYGGGGGGRRGYR